jgi:hypothetical protein
MAYVKGDVVEITEDRTGGFTHYPTEASRVKVGDRVTVHSSDDRYVYFVTHKGFVIRWPLSHVKPAPSDIPVLFVYTPGK